MDFIDKEKNENLPVGKYELEGERLFAIVQKYSTKDKKDGRIESHKKYLDMQYIVEGQEMIYCYWADKLHVNENQTPSADFIFYDMGDEQVSIKLNCGMFALLYPEDAHLPCCQIEKEKAVKKIVFKIAI